jgi:hypothetical protein
MREAKLRPWRPCEHGRSYGDESTGENMREGARLTAEFDDALGRSGRRWWWRSTAMAAAAMGEEDRRWRAYGGSPHEPVGLVEGDLHGAAPGHIFRRRGGRWPRRQWRTWEARFGCVLRWRKRREGGAGRGLGLSIASGRTLCISGCRRMIDTATAEAMAGVDARHAHALSPLCTEEGEKGRGGLGPVL